VRIRVQNLAGEPIEALAYSYVLAGSGEKTEGHAPTDSSGWLEEVVPIDVHALELHVADFPQSVQVHPGVLDPLRDEDTKRAIPSGIHARLLALGYDAGPPVDRMTAQFREAVETFQAIAMKSDAPTGNADRLGRFGLLIKAA
jgi:hypothetical protein